MVFVLLVVLLFLYIFSPWFLMDKTLSSGDFPYLFLENIKEFSFFSNERVFWLVPYYQTSAKILVEYIGLGWNFAEKILWFWPFLIFSIVSSFYLTRSWIGVLIYTVSTYPLMMVGGAQMGVAIAYSLAPLVLVSFIKIINRGSLVTNNFQFSIFNFQLLWAGLSLAAQVMFDPRVAYISFIAIFLYLFLAFIFNTNKKIFILKSFFLLIPIIIALVLNSFWIISVLKYGFPFAHEGYSSILGFQFLSFADFSHTFSILHPNWPENIFGKVYFMQPEFIVLPILAYSSLFFFNSKFKIQNSKLQLKIQNVNNGNGTMGQRNNGAIIFFALLGLLGAFLAKGANPPLGQINEFLFNFFPGMSMFRDSTKFYLLIVLSYSVLIPFAIWNIYERLKFSIFNFQFSIKYKIFNLQNLFLLFAILYLIFLIRPAVLGQLGGTFRPREVPNEYIQLKNFLHNQPEFFKTLWIPQRQRFGFYSNNHPAVIASDFFRTNSTDLILNQLKIKDSQSDLQKNSIRYVIVPYDSEGEIFLEDRKYSEKEYSKTVEKLKKIPFLVPFKSFGKIIVFQIVQ